MEERNPGGLPPVETWLTACQALAERTGSAQIRTEFSAIRQRHLDPVFRLAIVGEFNAGKSTLINRLLGREVLPVGALPTTAAVTALAAGAPERLEVAWADGRRESRAVNEDAFADLQASLDPSEETTLPMVRVVLDHPWLKELGMELADTPGIADLSSHRTGVVLDYLSRTDAVVLTVKAAQPLTMAEAAFLENEVLARRVQRLLVVVTQLDLLRPEERAPVMRLARDRVAKVAPGVAVLPSCPVDTGATEAGVLAELRAQIGALVPAEMRRAWRARRTAGLLADFLTHVADVGNEAVAAARMSEQKREEALRDARAKLAGAQLLWDEISLQLEARRLKTAEAIRAKVMESKADLVENLVYDISKTNDPKAWWDRDLPFKLRRELTTLGRKLSELTARSITADHEWLRTTAGKAFGVKLAAAPGNLEGDSSPYVSVESLELADLKMRRTLSRVATGVASVLGHILLGPVGTVAGLSMGLLGEKLLNRKAEAQRRLLEDNVHGVVEQILMQYNDQVSGRLRSLYEELILEAKKQEETWLSAREAALNKGATPGAADRWEPVLAQAEALRKEILGAL